MHHDMRALRVAARLACRQAASTAYLGHDIDDAARELAARVNIGLLTHGRKRVWGLSTITDDTARRWISDTRGSSYHRRGGEKWCANAYSRQGRFPDQVIQAIVIYRDCHDAYYAAIATTLARVRGRAGIAPSAFWSRGQLLARIDPRFVVYAMRARQQARRRVRRARLWWIDITRRVDPRQRALVRRHLMDDGSSGRRARWDWTRASDAVHDTKVAVDEYGTLLAIERAGGRYCYCIVADATHPERLHALPVPPETKSCHAGLAWCAGMAIEEYRPAIEA